MISCSVFVLPVPVAPATRPCRFSIPIGTRMRADGCGGGLGRPRCRARRRPRRSNAVRRPRSAPRPRHPGRAALPHDPSSVDFAANAVVPGPAAAADAGASAGPGPVRTDQRAPPWVLPHRHPGPERSAAGAPPPGGPTGVDRVGPVADKGLDRLVWVDCEMTGLDLRKDALDRDRRAGHRLRAERILDAGVDIVIKAPDELLDGMVPVVQRHARLVRSDRGRPRLHGHRRPGRAGRCSSTCANTCPDARTVPLCGNSIATDRAFLARDMPELDGFLHYRMVDVSSVKELTRRWYPRVYFSQPQKGLAHRALADIKESIRELRYYREARCSCRCPARPPRPAQKASAEAVSDRPEPEPLRCPRPRERPTVGVAQLAEHLVVVQGVVGSSPITHPVAAPALSAPDAVSVLPLRPRDQPVGHVGLLRRELDRRAA